MPTRIANSPPFIKGVVNLRGTIVPIVDMRLRFGCSSAGVQQLHGGDHPEREEEPRGRGGRRLGQRRAGDAFRGRQARAEIHSAVDAKFIMGIGNVAEHADPAGHRA